MRAKFFHINRVERVYRKSYVLKRDRERARERERNEWKRKERERDLTTKYD